MYHSTLYESIFRQHHKKLKVRTKLTISRTTKEITGFGAANIHLWHELRSRIAKEKAGFRAANLPFGALDKRIMLAPRTKIQNFLKNSMSASAHEHAHQKDLHFALDTKLPFKEIRSIFSFVLKDLIFSRLLLLMDDLIFSICLNLSQSVHSYQI
jgi:hypothetical protein